VTVLVEGALRFEFGASWKHVMKYDAEPLYREGIEGLKGRAACDLCQGQLSCERCHHKPTIDSRAVDIVGSRGGDLYFIEIKDFRRRGAPKPAALATEVARKVRDTLAGLIGALHGRSAAALRPLIVPVVERPPRIILWLEEDMDARRIEQRGDPALIMRGELKKRLHWLSGHVWVVNLPSQATRLGSALDLAVRPVPRGVVELRELMPQRGAISSEDYCRVTRLTPQVAGERLARLCAQGRFCRIGDDRYAAGPSWDEYDEDG
jgi:hypothetical protein